MAKKKKTGSMKFSFPNYCDYSCKFAGFSDPESIGACRKDLAVWCKHFKRYNNKNNRCLGLNK
ncbi:MAG: hypothetical protein JW995_01760 [Melioribacteraceae bacterium]|nr:hypothetical protein [Melioribacteraceae bacterium]